MRSAANDKSMRLMFLTDWAKAHYEPKKWLTEEFIWAISEYAMMKYIVSEGQATTMAKIVQLRLTRRMPPPVDFAKADNPSSLVITPVELEEKMSVTEIIGTHAANNPDEYSPPLTDFKVISENTGMIRKNERIK